MTTQVKSILLHNNLLPITSMRSDSHLSALRQSVSPPPPPRIHPSMQSIHSSARALWTKKNPSLAYRDCLRPCRFAGVPGRSGSTCVRPRRRLVSARFLCSDRGRLLVPPCWQAGVRADRQMVQPLSRDAAAAVRSGVDGGTSALARGQIRRRRGTNRDGDAPQWRDERCFGCVRRVCCSLCSILRSSVTEATLRAGRRHEAPPLPPPTPPPHTRRRFFEWVLYSLFFYSQRI